MKRKAAYNLGYQRLQSQNIGVFNPIGWKEILPGDSVRHSVTALIRTSPLLKPLMHRVNAQIVHYFVPTRVMWPEFKDFITGGPQGTSAPVAPYITIPNDGFDKLSLADYLGLQPEVGGNLKISALPFRAYAMIFNEWVRDQDLITPVNVSTASGADSITNTDLLMAMWEKDWLTTSRPWPQKGPEVMLPIVGDADVKGIGAYGSITGASIAVRETDGTNPTYTTGQGTANPGIAIKGGPAGSDWTPDVYADMTTVAGVSIVDQRVANYIQRFQEKMSRTGSQFKDYLRMLGIKFSDASLQLPQRLGSTTTVMQFSEVLATAQSADVDVGDMKGHGITGIKTKGYDHWFEEHGVLMSFLVVRPKTVYMNMANPFWFYETKYDYWQPGLEHVGQAEILNKMVHLGHDTPNGVFGYQDRMDHLRYSENEVAGEFRDLEADWHMGRDLPTDVALNADFRACNPTDRIWPTSAAVSQHLKVNALHNLLMRRLVSPNVNSFIR